MNSSVENLLLLSALVASFSLLPPGRVTAQTFTNLHSFTATLSNTNSDGVNPIATLVLSGNTLYGTAKNGGSGGWGTVFKVNTDGTGFTNLHNFPALAFTVSPATNTDGAVPWGELVLSGNKLYGTAANGGIAGRGSLFVVNTDGTAFTNLYNFTRLVSNGSIFTNADGAIPEAGLILSGNRLYGTANSGGASSRGTIFAINTDGTGFTNLHSFSLTVSSTNGEGAYPESTLILSSNMLYGTAAGGGISGRGAVFAIQADGTGFTNLHSFLNGGDGYYPYGGMVLSGNTLYGTTDAGGASGVGTVFAIHTDGTGFTNLYSFSPDNSGTNSDGALPQCKLFLSGNILYGTAPNGGPTTNGTVFALNTDGSGFITLYTFTVFTSSPHTNSDGAYPYGGVILSGNTLFGTASSGGTGGNGSVFSLSLPLPPLLAIIRSATNVILTWPTNATVFTLQSTTNLVPPRFWIANPPAPFVVNGQNTVTNPVTGTQKFYRLSQ